MDTVSDLMTVNPVTVSPDTPLSLVWDIMHDEGYRQLPVVDGEELLGIITDRDLRAHMLDSAFQDAPAEVFMTPEPITVTPHTPAHRAAEMLRIYKFGALPVVDGRRLVGIITVSDFLRREAETGHTARSQR